MLFRTLLGKLSGKIKPKRQTTFKVPEMPSTVYIELTNHCNLRCIMCTFHSPLSPFLSNGKLPREKGFMERDLALRIIDELGQSKQPISIALHGAGEPLLHKELASIVSHGAKYENLDIGFLTNSMLLSKSKSLELISAGLKWISFSIDGNNPELFNRYRKGGDYNKVFNNVVEFIELAKVLSPSLRTHINMTVQEEMWPQVDEFVKFWLQKVERVSISPCRPMGSRKSELVPPNVKRIPCYMLYSMMVIFWDGSVGICCEDWFNEGKMGNVKEKSLSFIWKGKKFSWAREMHEKGLYHKIPLCKDCDIWFNGTPEVTYQEGYAVTKNAWQWEYRRCLTAT